MARVVSFPLLLASVALAICAAGQAPPWMPRKDRPERGALALAAGIGGKIYVLTSGEERHDGADVYEYDPGADSWRKRSGAPSRRCGFGGTALDGKIYIWGGVNRGSAPGRDALNDTVEVYDPAADSWSVMQARMPEPRLFAAGAAVNGKLYAVGGIRFEDGKETSAVHEYDPRADRWSERKPMLFQRRVYRVAATGGKLYAIGGYSDAYADLLVEEYDPATDQWTRRPNQFPRNYDHAVAVAGDGIWIIGGASPGAQVYTPRSGQWSKRPDFPDPAPGLFGAVVSGRVFVVCGLNQKLYEFNPEGKEAPAAARKPWGWQKRADMPTPRKDHFAVAAGEKVYILGGSAGTGAKAEPTNAVDVYDTVADRWTAAKPSPGEINKAAAVDGRIYAFGKKASYRYDPAADAWTEIAPLPTGRQGFAIAVLNGNIYVIGGMTPDPAHRWGFHDGDAVEVYNPKTNEWEQKAKLSEPGHALTAVVLKGRIYLVGQHRLEVYDPTADSWTKLAPIPGFSAYCGAFEMYGRILVLPGMLASTWAMQEYDPAGNAWRVSGIPAHTRRRLYASASVNGKIYTFGGVEGIEWEDWNRPIVGLTEELNP